MTDAPEQTKPGFRRPKQREAADTEFRRLIGLCGLNNPEAAQYLGISEQTASQKSMGRRPMMDVERDMLMALWAAITNYQHPLDLRFPAGARRQQAAYAMAQLSVRGREDEYGHMAWGFIGAAQVQYIDEKGELVGFEPERKIIAKRQRKPRVSSV